MSAIRLASTGSIATAMTGCSASTRSNSSREIAKQRTGVVACGRSWPSSVMAKVDDGSLLRLDLGLSE